MYTRIKKIKNIEYVYLVKSYWSKRKKSPKQKTLKYLGRLYRFKKTKNKALEQYLNIKDIENYFNKTSIKKIIKDLIKLELHNYNFKEIKPNIWKQEDIIVDLKSKILYNSLNKKQACIEINNNFLSNKTLRNIINLKFPPGLTNIQIGKYLANSFLSTGIVLSEDKFVILSQRILKKINNI